MIRIRKFESVPTYPFHLVFPSYESTVLDFVVEIEKKIAPATCVFYRLLTIREAIRKASSIAVSPDEYDKI